jgi:hypothetical protein
MEAINGIGARTFIKKEQMDDAYVPSLSRTGGMPQIRLVIRPHHDNLSQAERCPLPFFTALYLLIALVENKIIEGRDGDTITINELQAGIIASKLERAIKEFLLSRRT